MNFESFNLNPKILAGVKAQGYTSPTPIQEEAIPPIMQGRDIIGLAQTGTGKTAAFVLPVLHRLVALPRGQVRALIISPTRELAEQTCETINILARYTGLRCISIYGGVAMEPQKRALGRGVEIIVACPGRLLDHLLKGTIDLSLVEVLIIDEADRMFDMGFLPDIRNIVRCLTRPRQTLLFSATMPADIRRLVQEVLRDPLTINIKHSAPVESISHSLYPVQPHLKTALLKEILRTTETNSVIVFTRTKHRVDRVAEQLARSGYKVASLQGDMTQNRRQEAIEGFRDGSLKIMVATDIAARGLDVLSISHVINYDMPDTADAYTHRIGRTGRVNNTGEAYTLVTGEDRAMIKELEHIFKKPLETRKIPGFNYTAEAPKPSGAGSVRRTSKRTPNPAPAETAISRRRFPRRQPSVSR
ncbi:MAG TPA: DEAD/DEAH box helicase [Dehalococcoidales bacterium]|nr:DEAD/DEAH box helicase [Dehalococcoidales bacterium]